MFSTKLVSVFQLRRRDDRHQWAMTMPATSEAMAELELMRTRPDPAYPTFAPTAPMELPCS